MGAITLLTGRVSVLPGSDKTSGIDKHPVHAALVLGLTGFDGDQQADLRVHGGPEKAVHHYPRDHYDAWRADLGPLQMLDTPGAFGENISGHGVTERTVAVGDVFRLGTALVQVSQGRQPCWKLNLRFGVPDMARRVQATGRTGWYYRVLEAGRVAPGDRLDLVERLAPEWSLWRLWHTLYVDRMNLAELQAMAGLEVLAESWRRYAQRRVESGQVEDWTKRLEGRA